MENLRTGLILIVDDTPKNLQVLGSLLRNHGHKLAVAQTGSQAIEYAKRYLPDLILLDVMMPVMDGYETCKQLKTGDETKEIPIIFLTAKSDIADEQKGFSCGAVDYITKPFNPQLVISRVNTHLSLNWAKKTIQIQRDKLKQSLDLAMEVQQNLLPRVSPVVPGLDIAGRSKYCDTTGGDYFDFIPCANGRDGDLFITVGDVSGHGIQSALLMASVRATLRLRASQTQDLGQIVSDVNRMFCKDIRKIDGHFMTLFLCDIDREERTIRWVRAGHDPAILYDAEQDIFSELRGEGNLPIGIFETEIYTSVKADVCNGQIIVIGTDGIWESENADGKMFGKERLKELIKIKHNKPASQILEAVFDAVESFCRPLSSKDDQTLIVIKLLAKE